MVTKADADATGGSFDLLDHQTVPAGYAPPRHVHRHEDEAWYILDGEVTFWCGGEELHAGRGGFVFLPRDIEHTFKVGVSGARLLTIAVPSGFAAFVRAAGEPAHDRVVPPVIAADPATRQDRSSLRDRDHRPTSRLTCSRGAISKTIGPTPQGPERSSTGRWEPPFKSNGRPLAPRWRGSPRSAYSSAQL